MKDKILETASQKIQLYGLKKFTLDEIAIELKISKKTIYKYFSSKDEIINQFFNSIIESDKKNVLKQLKKENSLLDNLNSIIYSYHKFKLPVSIIDETRKFYPEQWVKVEELKKFKLDILYRLLKEGASDGVIKADVNFLILSRVLDSVCDTFLDYKFLSDNKITFKEAINEVINIILYGIIL
ncbi:TetR/AcrR family transcriptional regulator [Clostridium brassicae]|uniref:TetR/AcrR family transcriptional regulator n=1 Tax=Clostridium brassicae TaxID=2999072 RepID=A0ABT4DC88_9CLOT|nr:TetR/AcrR family transcriptional regulator [Clostridium brassicae]MCY6959798.1 TetR/AcrR family transcriptional regulator [Clostridium brassicae]